MIIFFAFVFFGMSMYQDTAPFNTFARSLITCFGYTFGDSMREMLFLFKDEPMAAPYFTLIVLIFYSSLAQIYVVLFMSQFEAHLEEKEEKMRKKEEKEKETRERLLLMDIFDQKTFSIQANAFINFIEKGEQGKEGSDSGKDNNNMMNAFKEMVENGGK